MVKADRGQLRQTISFLRLAAVEMGRLAERAPEIAVELRRVAQQLEAEADGLEQA